MNTHLLSLNFMAHHYFSHLDWTEGHGGRGCVGSPSLSTRDRCVSAVYKYKYEVDAIRTLVILHREDNEQMLLSCSGFKRAPKPTKRFIMRFKEMLRDNPRRSATPRIVALANEDFIRMALPSAKTTIASWPSWRVNDWILTSAEAASPPHRFVSWAAQADAPALSPASSNRQANASRRHSTQMIERVEVSPLGMIIYIISKFRWIDM
jgi:hypothetical protein